MPVSRHREPHVGPRLDADVLARVHLVQLDVRGLDGDAARRGPWRRAR